MNKKQVDLLVELFMQDFPDKMKNPRMWKSETLFKLAKDAMFSSGTILELGTYHGNGAICLAWGAKEGKGQFVHTCDPYVDSHGWIGEEYLAADRAIALKNFERAKVMVVLHQERSEELVKNWDRPLSLWFWDIGDMPKGRLVGDFDAWSEHVFLGGKIAIKEPGEHGFGGKEVIHKAIASKKWSYLTHYPGYIWTMTRVA